MREKRNLNGRRSSSIPPNAHLYCAALEHRASYRRPTKVLDLAVQFSERVTVYKYDNMTAVSDGLLRVETELLRTRFRRSKYRISSPVASVLPCGPLGSPREYKAASSFPPGHPAWFSSVAASLSTRGLSRVEDSVTLECPLPGRLRTADKWHFSPSPVRPILYPRDGKLRLSALFPTPADNTRSNTSNNRPLSPTSSLSTLDVDAPAYLTPHSVEDFSENEVLSADLALTELATHAGLHALSADLTRPRRDSVARHPHRHVRRPTPMPSREDRITAEDNSTLTRRSGSVSKKACQVHSATLGEMSGRDGGCETLDAVNNSSNSNSNNNNNSHGIPKPPADGSGRTTNPSVMVSYRSRGLERSARGRRSGSHRTRERKDDLGQQAVTREKQSGSALSASCIGAATVTNTDDRKSVSFKSTHHTNVELRSSRRRDSLDCTTERTGAYRLKEREKEKEKEKENRRGGGPRLWADKGSGDGGAVGGLSTSTASSSAADRKRGDFRPPLPTLPDAWARGLAATNSRRSRRSRDPLALRSLPEADAGFSVGVGGLLGSARLVNVVN